jgi:hypothetical protein
MKSREKEGNKQTSELTWANMVIWNPILQEDKDHTSELKMKIFIFSHSFACEMATDYMLSAND